MADLTIIGAGVAGLWAAYAASLAGLRPRLLDQHGPPGPHGCSWWAGGMLAPFCEGAITADPLIVKYGQQAAAHWAKVTQVIHNGSLVVALARDKAAELTQFARRAHGHRRVTDIKTLEVDLSALKEGLFFASESHLDPRLALADLTAALSAQGIGIQIATATPDAIDGPVIDARGFGAELPNLRAVRGEMLVIKSADITLSRPLRLLHPRHPIYIVPRANGVYMLGATQIESDHRGAVTARSALELLSAAYALDSRFAQAEILEMGADLRPAFDDNIPRVIAKGRVLYINGLFRHGYLMAPSLALQAIEYLCSANKGELVYEDED